MATTSSTNSVALDNTRARDSARFASRAVLWLIPGLVLVAVSWRFAEVQPVAVGLGRVVHHVELGLVGLVRRGRGVGGDVDLDPALLGTVTRCVHALRVPLGSSPMATDPEAWYASLPTSPCSIARRSISCWNQSGSCCEIGVPSSANARTSEGTSCQYRIWKRATRFAIRPAQASRWCPARSSRVRRRDQ